MKSSLLVRDYRSNSSALRTLDTLLRYSPFITNADTLIVIGSASVEGGETNNQYLAKERAEAIKGYLRWQYAEIGLHAIKTTSRVSTWDDMIPLVEADTVLPYKAEILAALSHHNSATVTEQQLRNVANGKAWRYIRTHYLPLFRAGNVYIVFDVDLPSKQIQPSESSKVVDSQRQDNTPTITSTPLPSEEPVVAPSAQSTLSVKEFTPAFAMKTDLMLWGGVMPNFRMGTWTPNLSAEVYFAKKWSVQLGWAYSNWNSYTGDKHLFSVSAFDIEGRYWIKSNNKYNALFTSIYAQSGDYDKQAELTGQTGTFWSAGVGAGYLLPLSRHWGLEAQLRLGYRSSANEHYNIEPGHYYLNSKQTDGALNAQFRLQVVYRFGKLSKR